MALLQQVGAIRASDVEMPMFYFSGETILMAPRPDGEFWPEKIGNLAL